MTILNGEREKARVYSQTLIFAARASDSAVYRGALRDRRRAEAHGRRTFADALSTRKAS